MTNWLNRLYTTKLQLAAVIVTVVGLALLLLGRAVDSVPTFSWLVGWPASELGAVLVGIGVFSVINDYYTRQEADAKADERLGRAIRREIPAIRDAVFDSLAFNADALKQLTSEDSLDRIATNALALRLKDPALARDLYVDLRTQVISSPERWRDVDASVSLSPWTAGPASGHGSMFVATIRWHYRVRPTSSVLRFACVADLSEYRELLRDPTVTSAWHFDQSAGLDAASTEVFELLQLNVDGKNRPIRRSGRVGSQTYSATLGAAATDGREVAIVYTYRVLVQRHGHLLYLDLPRPTKGLHVQLDYRGTGIRRVNTLDYFASSAVSRLDETTQSTPAKTVDVSFDGWIFPRSGVAFAWVLNDEL